MVKPRGRKARCRHAHRHLLPRQDELERRTLLSAVPVLLKDIQSATFSSSPAGFTALGNRVLFTATTFATGRELYASDGTGDGTVLLANINPGPANANPGSFGVVGSTCYFTAYEGTAAGWRLWKTDGTPGGTVPVAASPGDPGPITAFDGTLYFTASDTAHGNELWRIDPATGAPSLFVDINPGASSSAPSNLTAAGDLLYFLANDGTHGNQLWSSDGTPKGTWLTSEIVGSPGGLLLTTPMTPIGNTVYFGASDVVHGSEPWYSDGTPEGSGMLADLQPGAWASSSPSGFTALGNRVLFTATTQATGDELYVSDGTTAGTVLLKDINPGSSNAFPTNLGVAGPFAYFTANDGTGPRLWKTDGTPEGTVRVPGAPTVPWAGVALGGTIVFVGIDADHGRELWRIDPTTGAAELLKDIRPGPAGSNPVALTVAGNRLYLIANDGLTGPEVWTSDGTTAGTRLAADAVLGSRGIDFGAGALLSLTPVGSSVYFAANDPQHGLEPWHSDGTPQGTGLLEDIETATDGSGIAQFVPLNGRVVFAATDQATGQELYASDGTPEGTVLLADVAPGPTSSAPAQFTTVGSTCYFTASEGGDTTLWKTDGTPGGTIPVASSPRNPQGLVAFDGTVFFAGTDDTYGTELWWVDPATGAAALWRDIDPGSGGSGLVNLTAAGGLLYFLANDGTHGNQLWTSDGTADGTRLVTNSVPGPTGLTVSGPLIAVGRSVYFAADDDFDGVAPWHSDGTAAGTGPLADLAPGPDPSNPYQFTPLGTRVVFAATTPQYGFEPYVTDGSPGSCQLLADIAPGAASSGPHQFTVVGSNLYFIASSGSGSSLWKTDGTPQGTAHVSGSPPILFNLTPFQGTLYFEGMEKTGGFELFRIDPSTGQATIVQTLAPNVTRTLNDVPVVAGNRLYYAADDGIHGRILWKTDGTPDGTFPVLNLPPGATPVSPRSLTAVDHTVFFTGYLESTGAEPWSYSDNDPPRDQTIATVPDRQNVAIAVPFQATDPDGDTLAFTVTAQPQHGSLGGTSPNLVYTPALDYNGTDALGYRIDDGHGGVVNGTVTITVRPDAAPIDQTANSVTTRQNVAISVPLQATDPDGDPFAFTITTPPHHGTLSGVAPNLVYTPASNFSGADAFAYRIDDGHGGGVNGTVVITVRADVAPIDQTATSVITRQNVAVPVPLQATDPDGDPLVFSVTTVPQHGALSGTAPNLVYTPTTNYFGGDAFGYRIDDGRGGLVNGVAAITVRDVTPPQVVDLKVHWGTQGVASILNTTRVLPWQGVNAIEVVFSEDVAVTQASLALTGVKVPRYATTFHYGAASHTARWTLLKPTAVDRVLLSLTGQGSSAVTDRSGNRLGGGVDFQRTLRILPGDLTGDGQVNSADVLWVRSHVTRLGKPNPLGDVDGNGKVNQADLQFVRKKVGTHLPSAPVRVRRSLIQRSHTG